MDMNCSVGIVCSFVPVVVQNSSSAGACASVLLSYSLIASFFLSLFYHVAVSRVILVHCSTARGFGSDDCNCVHSELVFRSDANN